MIEINKLPPFKRMCVTIGNLPTSFMESMSYYEALQWLYDYLANTIIPTVNNNGAAITELQTAFTLLQDYVDNYFDNLDVQTEINNKLDSMAEDGSLTRLIKAYIDPIQEAFEETLTASVNASITEQNEAIAAQSTAITGQNSAIQVLEGRMDEFTSLAEGSTSGDAELADIRTSYTGEVYSNAGNAVRGEVGYTANETGTHIYNLSTRNVNQNYYDYGTGTQNDIMILKLMDYTGTPGTFIVYGKATAESNWENILYCNTADQINACKKYTRIKLTKNYYMIRLFMGYSGTGTSENVNVLFMNMKEDNINNRVFTLEDSTNTYNSLVKESGLSITNLSIKNANQNYYEFGSLSSGDTLIYKIEDYTGTPTTFVIYVQPENSSSWYVGYQANTSESIASLKNALNYYTADQNYQAVRIMMVYSGTGLSESVNMLLNKLSNNNLLTQTIKNTNAINNIQFGVSEGLYKVFKKVVCCGDSYTAGYISVGGDISQFSGEFSWPHYMATKSGNEYINCGVTGTTCKTWQSNQYGLAKANSQGDTQAYICGWAINDSNSSLDVYLPVGETSDIGTNNDTFYAQYSKVIRELHNISNDAIIFVQTCPDSDNERYAPYNAAIKYIANAYKSTYHTHCLDLAEYSSLYATTSISQDYIGSHYTAIGYEQFAEILAHVMSEYIASHISDFQSVAFIPYD